MALNDNRLDVAERILKPHLKEDPFDAAAIRMLAELAARIGRWGDAENLLRRAIEIAPGFDSGAANLALVLGRTGRPAEALELLDEIFEIDPEDLGILNLKAATLGKLGDFDEALELYEGLLEQDAQPAADLAELWPYAENCRSPGRRRCRLSPGARHPAALGRSVVEPRQPEDGQVRRVRHRGDGVRR